MNTQKVAITVPSDLLVMIDTTSKKLGMSRSRYISSIIKDHMLNERDRLLKDTYNRVFSDSSMIKEQLDTAAWFEGSGSSEGQEW